jgi:hypothetical protein
MPSSVFGGTRRIVAALAVIFAASCSPSPTAPPAQPQAPTPSGSRQLQEVVIAGVPSVVHPGTSQSARAVAHYSDGSYVDVTGSATWSSSDPACAANAGQIAGVAAGIAEIRAAFGGMASAAVRVACGYVVTITTTENFPTKDVRVPGVEGEVLDGPLAGTTFVTDTRGEAVLPPVMSGGFRIRFKKSGFTNQVEVIRELPRDTTFGVAMVPEFGVRREFVGGCHDGEDDVRFSTPRAGPMRLTIELTEVAAPYPGTSAYGYVISESEGVVIVVADYATPPSYAEPRSLTYQAAAGEYRFEVLTGLCSLPDSMGWRAVLEYAR